MRLAAPSPARSMAWHVKLGIYRLNTLVGYRHKSWILGDGRSGTTWLQELMGLDGRSRLTFEPLHPRLLEWIPDDRLLYLRPQDEHPELEKAVKAILSGTLKTRSGKLRDRLGTQPSWKFYRSLVVKDIFGHLFANWIQANFHDVRLIVILRHPYDVALSKMRLSDWKWIDKPAVLLHDDKLVQDHFAPHTGFIQSVSGTFNEHVLSWALMHYVLFRTIDPQRTHIVFYEALRENTRDELNAVMQFHYNEPDYRIREELVGHFTRPSKMSVAPGTTRGDQHRRLTLEEVTGKEGVESANRILQRFGLDALYDERKRPLKEGIETIVANLKKA